MTYWLMKTEPSVYGIDDLEREKTTPWEGVRNYQARNFMKNDMAIGDKVLFYHSNTVPPGIVGMAEVCRLAYPDFTQYDASSRYYDPKSPKENPRWWMVDLAFVRKFNGILSLQEIREDDALDGILVAKKGQRLSVQPVEAAHYRYIVDKMS